MDDQPSSDKIEDVDRPSAMETDESNLVTDARNDANVHSITESNAATTESRVEANAEGMDSASKDNSPAAAEGMDSASNDSPSLLQDVDVKESTADLPSTENVLEPPHAQTEISDQSTNVEKVTTGEVPDEIPENYSGPVDLDDLYDQEQASSPRDAEAVKPTFTPEANQTASHNQNVGEERESFASAREGQHDEKSDEKSDQKGRDTESETDDEKADPELRAQPSDDDDDFFHSKGLNESSKCSKRWTNTIFEYIHEPIIYVLDILTQKVVLNPKRTLASFVLFSLASITIGVLTNFHIEFDDYDLWTPSDAVSRKHHEWSYGENYPDSDLFLYLLVHRNGENVLRLEDARHAFEALDEIRTISGFDEVCAQGTYLNRFANPPQPGCRIWGLPRFYFNDIGLFNLETTDEEMISTISGETYPDGIPFEDNDVFGNAVRDDSGKLISAESIVMSIAMPDLGTEQYEVETRAIDMILDIQKQWEREGRELQIEVLGASSFPDEFFRAILGDVFLIPLVFSIMIIFVGLYFARRNALYSRAMLGMGAVLSIFLSVMATYGVMFIIGVPYTTITTLIPFLNFGVGLDDAFVIMGAYARTDSSKPTNERIRDTVREVGVSITLTTLTSSTAFALGIISSIPTVDWLCFYLFPGIMLVFVYQMTVFIAMLVLDERRIAAGRRDFFICWKVHEFQNFQNEGTESNDRNGQEAQLEEQRQIFYRRAMRWYAERLLYPPVRVLVVVIFAVLLGSTGYSAFQLTQSFTFTDAVPSDSYILDFADALTEHSTRSFFSTGAYFRFVDQSDPEVQAQMEQFVDNVVALDAVGAGPEFFWLKDFKLFLELGEGLEDKTFNEQLDEFLAFEIFDALYSDTIARDEYGNITSSYVWINMDNLAEADIRAQIRTLHAARDLMAAEPINEGSLDGPFILYSDNFELWEFYEVAVSELTTTTVLGVCVMSFLALIFIPHWTAVLFVAPLISALYLEIMGIMQWGGVHVNAISYVALAMSIGLLVDYVLHMILRYFESKGTRREKTIETLETMGVSVLVGGVTTFMGVMPLVFSTSEIMRTVFIACVGLVTMGLSHALILLPVVLATIGPEEAISHETTTKTKSSELPSPEGVGYGVDEKRGGF